MAKRGATILDATREWVGQMNAIQQGMIQRLMDADDNDWCEVTQPSCGDRVYVFDLPDGYEGDEHHGEIESFLEESDNYLVSLDDGTAVEIGKEDLEVERDECLPMWGTMWSFGDSADEWWLEEGDGIEAMSRCGFRVYMSEEFGYFFGIDGAGYDFYEVHWCPLYQARGVQWHDPVAEKLYQMERKGYKRKQLDTKEYWFDGDRCIEEVQEIEQ